VSWAAPGANGGAPIAGYFVNVYGVPSDGVLLASCTTTGALSCPVMGLTNGTSYYVAVVAFNAAGTGPASSPRVAVTPLTTPQVSIAALIPGANDIAVDVNVISTGGAAIITFEYRLGSGEWQSASTATEPFTIGGLITGTDYVVAVRAVNVAGTGPASAPVNATPRTTPGIPGALVATRGNASVSLTWDPPTTNGGQPITDYVVQYATNANGSFTTFTDGTSTATSATVTGLSNGTAYVFRVSAVNVAGAGTATALVAATPLAPPNAPTITSISSGSQYLQVSFAAPSNGGSPITAYEYRLDGGTWRSSVVMGSPMTISGLTNGHTYQVEIRALNAVGPGGASNTVSAKPYGLPSAVAGFLASPGAGTVALSWDAASDNGSAITAYNIIRWSAASEGSIAATYQTTNTSYSVSGLSAGTT
jgi:predicted phage tail protein